MSDLSPIIQSFRQAHHTIARMFAMGLTIQEIEKRTGFTHRRLMLLSRDPSFLELIQHYRGPHIEKQLEAIAEIHEEMQGILAAVVRHTKMHIEEADENEEPLPLKDCIKIFGDMADRLGYSKHSVKTVVNVSYAEALDRCIERSGKREEIKLIEGQVAPTGLRPTGERVDRPNLPVPRLVERRF